MFKKFLSALLAAAMLSTFASAASTSAQTAVPSPHAIYVDGVKANVAAYTINGNNYFKLRDIAAIVNGSEKQFEVEWDGANQRIDLTSGKPYTVVGGELAIISPNTQTAQPSTDVIYKDGAKASFTGYKIGGNNFYKLRDVCDSFDIGVKWDGAMQRVDILTDEGYVDENETVTPDDETEETEEPEVNWIPGTKPMDFPDVGEYSDEYLAYLEESGEKIVTVTIKYDIYDLYHARLFTKSVPVSVESSRMNMPILTTMCGSDGKGEFTMKMTESDYAKIMSGDNYVFGFTFTNDEESFDGDEYTIGGSITQNCLLGYRERIIATP